MLKMGFDERLSMLQGVDISLDEINAVIAKKDDLKTGDSIAEILKITGTRRSTIQRAFESLEQPFVNALLEAWLIVAKNKPRYTIPAKICLTGIDPKGYPLRVTDTFQTFQDLVTKAKRRIAIIGYRFNDGNLPLIKMIDKRLKKDGLEIQVLTDHLMSRIMHGGHEFLKHWLKDTNIRFRLYSFEHPNPKEIMHIKCMLIDDDTTYLGSANFSYGGSKRNIELGIVLTDRQVNKGIDAILTVLIKGGSEYVQEITYTKLKKEGIIGG